MAHPRTLAPLADRVDLPHDAPWTAEHVYHLYVIRLRRHDRDTVLKRLRAAGVEAGIHYPTPIHRQAAYAELGLGEGSFPVTEDLARHILSLPLYPEMTREQVGIVAQYPG